MFKNLKKTDEKGLASPKGTEGGFTLIEILVVIGIIAILAAVVLVAINPAKQFRDANDSTRSSNVNAILNAVGQYIADNQGDLPPAIEAMTAGADPVEINAALCGQLVPKYIPALPTDPQSKSGGSGVTDCPTVDAGDVEYFVERDNNNRVTISAPKTQGDGDDISVTR